ncbi:5-hydroxytryptamine receptor 3A-like [Entelurus aequoreus]|uniref:5-hydroxytryptamine receptor 3A-like n=1 Tax=Entelurus aequoreus TaxID=161455 RepID=UPI002B1E1CD3|nr:5-hydroxytryptamine receptor 3A-like [Entelurus aequoreus]
MVMFAALILIPILSVGGNVSDPACSYQDVLDHLNLTKSNELYIMARPVRNYKQRTTVSLEVHLYAILDVVEKDQKFIPYVFTVTRWHNEYISWDPEEFCGIDNVFLPAEVLWKPDLTITERMERNKAPPTPYLAIGANGNVEFINDQILVSTCRMHIYKFPFDIQRCNLTYRSIIHPSKAIRLQPRENSRQATKQAHEVMRTQYEWVFLNMAVTAHTAAADDFDEIVYTITMSRKPILYIVNFVLPVLFFLSLDLASFLISDRGGEKLSFKITVLLAVTVMQLILNEILPSSTNRIPLIALYCIGIFGLMLLSLLETICVMYLMEKDDKSHLNGDENHGLNQQPNCRNEGMLLGNDCGGICSTPANEALNAMLSGARESQSGVLCQTLEKLSDELKAMERTLRLLHGGQKEELGYWSRLARRVNRIFFILYVTLVIVFLTLLFFAWTSD